MESDSRLELLEVRQYQSIADFRKNLIGDFIFSKKNRAAARVFKFLIKIFVKFKTPERAAKN